MENEFQLRLHIPEKEKNVLDNLEKIVSFCPSSILKKARKKDNLDQLLCNNPIANEVIRLNSEIQVDKHDEGVKNFADAIFNFVVSLCDLIRYMHRDLNFTVISGGSFPLNLKGEHLDEFDFVLVWKDFLEVGCLLGGFFQRGEGVLSSVIMDAIKTVLVKFNKNGKLSDEILIEKVHAINTEFSWCCPLNHKHSVSLDLAISCKTSVTSQEYFSKHNFPLKDGPFEHSLALNENVYWNCSLKFDSKFDRLDANIFDKQMLETCDGISPNIRLCYRILKFIRNHFFPYFVQETENYLTGKPIYYSKSVYSSHLLKQILFREVIKFPSHEQWKNSSIIIRITSMLKILSERSLIENVYNNELINLLKYNGFFSPILGDMIKWLQNGCKRSLLLRKNTQSDFNKNVKVLLNERMLVNLPKSLLSKCLKYYWGVLMHNVEIIILKSFPSTFLQSNISGGLFNAFIDSCEKMEEVNLTGVSRNDIEKIVLLLDYHVITKKEIESNNYFKKVNSFVEMLELYNISCSNICLLLSLSDSLTAYQPSSKDISLTIWAIKQSLAKFTTLEEVFSCMMWKERGFMGRALNPVIKVPFTEFSEFRLQVLQKVADATTRLSIYPTGDLILWILLSLKFLKNSK